MSPARRPYSWLPALIIVMTVVVMPQTSGRELAERMAWQRPEVKVLYMSGYTDDAVVRHGVLQEGTAFLQKPFTPDLLAQKVREVLDQCDSPTPCKPIRLVV